MEPDLNYIGHSYKRIDAAGKLTGNTRYLPDITYDNMVFACPIYSRIPFGRIVSINTEPARNTPGFIDLLLAGDIPGDNQVGVIFEDQPLLADDTVRFVGDSIGVVVAETVTAAQQAARAVQIDYERFDPIYTINASRDATENFIHKDNVACRHQVDKGDINQGFAAADRIITAELTTPFQEHYYLEPQGCIVIPDENEEITVYGSLQCIYYVQKAVARVLGISQEKVHVNQTPVGGGFGGKEDIPSEICARTALAAIRLNRPVKMVYNRRDDVQLTSKRHPFQMKYKVGVSKAGKLLAADITLEENAGAYATLSSVVSYRSAMQAMGPYVIPNIKVRSTSYYTNLPPTGAFRGFGSPQATFGHERVMDIIAHELGIDPVELRLRNVLRIGNSTQTGQKLTVSVGAEETIQRTAQAVGSEQNKNDNNRYLYGIGFAACHYGNCLGAAGWHMDGAGATLGIQRDGSVTVAYGLSDMGQGAATVNAQMAADALGVDVDRITVLMPSTDLVPDSGPGVASRNVVMTGNAIRSAAEKLIPILKSAAAEILNCPVNMIEIADDQAVDTDTGKQTDFKTIADYLYVNDQPVEMPGWWHVPPLEYDPEKGIGEAYFTYSFATHAARVKVDRLTGLVKVEKIWAAHDVGKVINPAGLEGQVEGGTAQGIGWALSEHFQIRDGVVQTANLSTYLLPTILDVSEVESIFIEAPEPLGPWGAKGIGEPAVIPTAAAIANAVSDAVGQEMNSIPLSPEMILRAIEENMNEAK